MVTAQRLASSRLRRRSRLLPKVRGTVKPQRRTMQRPTRKELPASQRLGGKRDTLIMRMAARHRGDVARRTQQFQGDTDACQNLEQQPWCEWKCKHSGSTANSHRLD